MEEKQAQGVHKIAVFGRHSGTITGVSDVLSFDEKEIFLETEQGMLTIKGKELHISRLTLEKGEVDIDGKVDSLVYSDGGRSQKKESVLGRLFK